MGWGLKEAVYQQSELPETLLERLLERRRISRSSVPVLYHEC